MVSGVLRGLGDSKRPMYFVLVACIINIVGDLLLVGVFGLGAAGAALATVAAQGVSLALALAVLRRRDFPFDFKRRSFRIQGDKAARILRLGLPGGGAECAGYPLFSYHHRHCKPHGCSGPIRRCGPGRAHHRLYHALPHRFPVGYFRHDRPEYGCGPPRPGPQGLKYGILFCLVADIAMFVLVQLVPGLAMRLFTPDAEVIYHGVLYLRTYSIDCILVTFVFTLNGFYSGCGRTGFTLFNSLASTFLVRVPAVFFISLLPGVTLLHIGVAAPAASAVQVLLQLLYFRTGRWNPYGFGGGADMTAEVLAFLGGAPGPISLFEAWEEAVLGLRGEHHEGVQNPDFLGKPPAVRRSLPAPAGCPAAGRGSAGHPGAGPPGGAPPASSRPWSPIPAAGPTI